MFGWGLVLEPEPEHAAYRGRVTIPYFTPTGVVQIKFRCIEDHKDCKDRGHEKYYGLSGAGVWIYNTPALLTDSAVIAICEGEIDAASVEYFVGLPAVGFPGTQSVRQSWYRAFTGFERVLVIEDGDEAGHKAGKAIAKHLPQADRITLPDKEDANSLLTQPDGIEAFRALIGIEESV